MNIRSNVLKALSALPCAAGPRCFSSSSGFRSRSLRSHYETLGVVNGCSDIKEIKAAFREKAKRLHPDVIKHSNSPITVKEAHTQFIELKHAYDVLIDPIQGASYAAQYKNSHSSGYDRHNYYNDHNEWAKEDERERHRRKQAEWRREFENSPFYRRAKKKRSERYGHDVAAYSYSAYESFKEDLELALQHAYEGPTFVPSAGALFPEQFEIEERSVKRGKGPYRKGMDVSHVVSGRQLLGTVREVESVMLEEDKWSKMISVDSGGVHSYEKMGLEDMTLELTWMNRKIAKAIRKSHDQIIFLSCNNCKDDINEKNDDEFTDNAPLYRHEATLVTSYSGMFNQYKRQTLLDRDGDPSHAIINQRSPGVQFINFHSWRGFLEFKCSKAWLPDSSWWAFEPRDEAFDSGGWYVEQNKDGKLTRGRVGSWRYKQFEEEEKMRERERMKGTFVGDHSIQETQKDNDAMSLCPTVPILLCAFHTLDNLRGRA